METSDWVDLVKFCKEQNLSMDLVLRSNRFSFLPKNLFRLNKGVYEINIFGCWLLKSCSGRYSDSAELNKLYSRRLS